jgi:hypothetical protein
VPKILDYLYPPVAIFSTVPNLEVAKYSNGLSIANVSVFERRDHSLVAKVQFVATNPEKFNSTVALHLNDKKGNLVFNAGAVALSSQSQSEDKLRVEASVELSASEYFSTSSIGIAVFKDPAVLYSVDSLNADWGYTRAIIFAQPKALESTDQTAIPSPSDVPKVAFEKPIDSN